MVAVLPGPAPPNQVVDQEHVLDIIIIYKWASYFSHKYVSNVQNTIVLYLGGSKLTISAVFFKHSNTTSGLGGHIGFLKKICYFGGHFVFLPHISTRS